MAEPANHVTPVPEEVQEAGAEEMEEPWEVHLRPFVEKYLEPIDKAASASTAAEVREAFFHLCGDTLQQREVRLKLARKGFHESTQAVREGLRKTTKRVYSFAFRGVEKLLATRFVRLRAVGIDR